MDKFHSRQLDYVYRLAQHIGDNYEPEKWESLEVVNVFHDYVWDHEDEGFRDLRLVAEIKEDGWETAPHNLVSELRAHGMELTHVSVEWDHGTASLIFHPLNL